MAAPSPALSEADSSASNSRPSSKRAFEDANIAEDSDSDGGAVTPGRDKRAGRRKIKIEYIEDKSRRHITFSKRKAGIMKKAYELSTLTGTQVLLLVVSETGLVYTFTTPKLQPIVTKPEGKNLIQACLNAPDPLPDNAQSSVSASPTSLRGGPQTPGYPQDHSAIPDPHGDMTAAAAAAAAAAAGLYSPPPVGADPHKQAHAPGISAQPGYPLGLANLGYASQPSTVGYPSSPMNAIAQQYGAVTNSYPPVGPYTSTPQPAHYGTSTAAAASVYAPYWSNGGHPHGSGNYTAQSSSQSHPLGMSSTSQ
jgi:pheromone receptor transcription factor